MKVLDSTELLYRAFRQRDLTYVVSPADLQFPDISVNRASLSKPEEVLKGRAPPVGVCSFPVSCIPVSISDSGKDYCFSAIEDSRPDNPAHAEIRMFVLGVHEKSDPPKAVRRSFRIALAAGIKIEIEP